MTKDNDKTGAGIAFLLILALILPVLAFMLWDQAFDFDPCNNIFTRTPHKCLEPGAEAIIAGLLAIILGVSIVFAGLRGVVRRVGNRLAASLITWIGLWTGICGTAYVYIAI